MTISDKIGLYGALLSTILLLWKVFELLRDRARVSVTINLRKGIESATMVPTERIVLKIVNNGRRPSTINTIGFYDKEANRSTIVTPSRIQLPYELTEGQSIDIDFGIDQFNWQTVDYAWAKDASEKLHKSKRRPLKLPGSNVS